MSYEMRRGKQYYYVVRRVNGRLVKSYLGRGPEAEQAAAEVARRQQDRADEQRFDLALEKVLLEFYRQFEAFWEVSEPILRMAFEAANYHRHRGEWRRRRDYK